MAIYYNLVFGLLISEMVFFTVLSLPFPRMVRKSVLSTFSRPFRNEQFQIGLKFVFGFVLILFVDSVNRVMAITNELAALSTDGHSSQSIAAAVGLYDRSEIQARRFYAQRNMYLCGFTLFLTLIITRTYALVDELTATKDTLDSMNAKNKVEDSEELKSLKLKLEQKDQDLDILKSQAKALSKDYDDVDLKQRK
jgi:hypothetical protein